MCLAKEPPDKNHPLINRDNVIMTPHMGGWTWDSRNDLQTKGAEEVVRVLKGERPKNVVNPEVCLQRNRRRESHDEMHGLRRVQRTIGA